VSVPLTSLLRSYQSISPGPRLSVQKFRNKIVFLRRGVITTSPNPQAGGSALVGCPRLLMQYIRSYPFYWWPFLLPLTSHHLWECGWRARPWDTS